MSELNRTTPAPLAAAERPERRPRSAVVLVIAGLVALQAVVLFAMGQPAICTCGTVRLWMGDTLSSENSQQLTDWYTFTHVVHGFLFYLVLWLVARRLPFGVRFALAVGIEVGWEVLENTPFVIDRYRQSALARGYVGDSVLNSIGDTLAMMVGFALARRLPLWSSIALVIAAELFLAFMIRDNLTFNIIQLIRPSDALSRWQTGG